MGTIDKIVSTLTKMRDKLREHSEAKRQEAVEHLSKHTEAINEHARASEIADNLHKLLGGDK